MYCFMILNEHNETPVSNILLRWDNNDVQPPTCILMIVADALAPFTI